MAKFVLKNSFFEFNGQIKQQISGTAIETKCAPIYACIYMKGEFLVKQMLTSVNHSQGKLETDLHIKPTDRYLYLH